jgi:hypothetical protein
LQPAEKHRHKLPFKRLAMACAAMSNFHTIKRRGPMFRRPAFSRWLARQCPIFTPSSGAAPCSAAQRLALACAAMSNTHAIKRGVTSHRTLPSVPTSSISRSPFELFQSRRRRFKGADLKLQRCLISKPQRADHFKAPSEPIFKQRRNRSRPRVAGQERSEILSALSDRSRGATALTILPWPA